MLLAVYFAGRWIALRSENQRQALATGLLALAMLLVAEVLLAGILFGKTPMQALFNKDPSVWRSLLSSASCFRSDAAFAIWKASRSDKKSLMVNGPRGTAFLAVHTLSQALPRSGERSYRFLVATFARRWPKSFSALLILRVSRFLSVFEPTVLKRRGAE